MGKEGGWELEEGGAVCRELGSGTTVSVGGLSMAKVGIVSSWYDTVPF